MLEDPVRSKLKYLNKTHNVELQYTSSVILDAVCFLANTSSHNRLQFQAIQRMDFWHSSHKGKRKERSLFIFCLEKSVAVGSGMLINKKYTAIYFEIC